LVGTIVGYFPGLVLPFAVIAKMGVDRLTDSFTFAIAVATFASGFFIGVLQPNVLPILQQAKAQGRRVFQRRLVHLTLQAVPVVTALYSIGGVAVIVYLTVGPRWSSQQRYVLIAAVIVLAVFVVASAVNGMLSGALNALGRFLSPAASQAIRSVVPLAALPLIPRSASGLVEIAALLSLAELSRTVVMAWELHSAAQAVPVKPSSASTGLGMGFWKAASPAALALAIVTLSPLIDRAVAATLSPGSTTLISLAENIFQVPLTIIATSLVLVAGTYWAAIGATDPAALRRDVKRTMIRGGAVAVALMLASLAVVWLGAVITGPRFAGARTSDLAITVSLLLVGLPAAFVISAGSRLLTSTQTTRLLPGLALLAFTTNFVLDVILARLFGVAGIALASTIFRVVNALLFLLIMRQLLLRGFEKFRVRSLLSPRSA
jgi:putative peptidoglycan lipid II flippase